ncbi:MAG: acyl-CoA dehydrogenase, partial [Myxococcales bacterium]
MSVDLEWEELQTAIADSVASYCSDRCGEQVARDAFHEFPRDVWKGRADLGVLALGSGADGGPLEICAAVESLGRALFPGPLAATFAAAGVLEGAARERLTSGEALVSLSAGGLIPWAAVADVFLVLEGGRLFEAEPAGEITAIETIGGEPWGRVALERVRTVGSAARTLAIHDMCVAAYTAACGNRLVELTCDHVRTRKQFGRAIGEFQAVAHPLANASMKLAAAKTLARAAAFELASGS